VLRSSLDPNLTAQLLELQKQQQLQKQRQDEEFMERVKGLVERFAPHMMGLTQAQMVQVPALRATCVLVWACTCMCVRVACGLHVCSYELDWGNHPPHLPASRLG